MLVHPVLGNVAIVEFLDESNESLAEKFVADRDRYAWSENVFDDGDLLHKKRILEQCVDRCFLNI